MSLYLYCLREPSRCGRDKAGTAPENCSAPRVARGELSVTCPAPSGIKSQGVNGKDGVIIRAFDGIEAVVSEVNFDDFGEMQKKAQEDIHWIKEKALAHEMVVEEAMGLSANVVAGVGDPGPACAEAASAGRPASAQPATACPAFVPSSGRGEQGRRVVSYRRPDLSPVIPIKFGVIFNTNERLAHVISGQSAAIRAAFDRIRAKQEWSVKLFLKDNQKFKDQVREQSKLFREKKNALAALPAGMAYFMEEEFNGELESECSRMLDEEAMKTFDELKTFAAEATLVKILDNKLTGRSERMILNSAYLVANIHLPKFEKEVSKMRGKLAKRGFLLEQGGPWPAYHFTEFANE